MEGAVLLSNLTIMISTRRDLHRKVMIHEMFTTFYRVNITMFHVMVTVFHVTAMKCHVFVMMYHMICHFMTGHRRAVTEIYSYYAITQTDPTIGVLAITTKMRIGIAYLPCRRICRTTIVTKSVNGRTIVS